SIRKHFSQFIFEICFLPQPPKIVDMKEAAARKKFTHANHLLIADVQATGLDDIHIGEPVHFRIHDVDDVWMRVNRKARQAMNTPQELKSGAGIIGAPPPSWGGEEIAPAELGTMIWRWLRHRAAKAAIAHAVFAITQSREIELGIGLVI